MIIHTEIVTPVRRITEGLREEGRRRRIRGKTPRKRNKDSQQDPVEVYCRIRPPDNPDDAVCVKVLSDIVVQLCPSEFTATPRNGNIKECQYTFQHVFNEYASQKALFDYVALPLVEDLLHGKNGLLFTYGITSSGKSYTMTGKGSSTDPGILPRCLDVVFNSIEGLQAKKYVFKGDRSNGFEVQTEADAMMERQKRDILPGITTPKTPRSKRPESARSYDLTRVDDVEEDNNYAVFVSYIEIYNNYVYDLLEELSYDPIRGYKPPQSKLLRTDATDTMFVQNCVETEVKSPDEAIEVLFKGQKRRKVANTALNAESSRSHSVFNIRLVQAPLDPRGEEVVQDNEKICVSQLSLVDLAGSERTVRTKNTGTLLKEAGNINQSLMALRTCFEVLRENQKSGINKMVPYRDSKITHLFKNYFEGDGKVRMIVCINPRAEEYDETIHVMKFAELTSEVLVQRSQQIKFDNGLPSGRRRLNQQFKEALEKDEGQEIVPPAMCYKFPSFPSFEFHDVRDGQSYKELELCLDERHKRRQTYLQDFDWAQNQFRNRLVELEQAYIKLKTDNVEITERSQMQESYITKLESKVRSFEKKMDDMNRHLKDSELRKTSLEMKLQDKQYKVQHERGEKERLKADFKAKLSMNNQNWEKTMERQRRQIELEAEAALLDKQRKLNLLRDIVNEDYRATPRNTKTRTYTTPASLTPAKSEPDVSSLGNIKTRSTTVGSAKQSSVKYGISKFGTQLRTPGTTPLYNPRHRRSKSSSNAEKWLDHRPTSSVELNTVLQPKMKKKKSVTKLDVKDTKEASKYCLTHQELDSNGEMETKYIKGDVLPTAAGGTAVVFNDVETLKQISPGSRKRRSSCPDTSDFQGEWTDTETRCKIAIEGHQLPLKRTKCSNV